MAILNFPDNPQLNDQYTGDNGTTYIFDGVKWVGHAVAQPAGTNSITNNGHTLQIDGDGNIVIPTGSHIFYQDGTALPDAQGPQGAKGDKGDPGIAATIDVGPTTTGIAGSYAAVSNIGTPTTAAFEFTIPRGDKGDRGPAGLNGLNGVGDPGPRGDKGDKGDQGVSVTLQGTKATIADLPAAPVNPNDFAGHGWIVTTGDGGTHLDGSLWFWNLTDQVWNDVGQIQGPTGLKGDRGDRGATGDTGQNGLDGAGVASGGSVDQVLKKLSSDDFDTHWATNDRLTNDNGDEVYINANGSLTLPLSSDTPDGGVIQSTHPVVVASNGTQFVFHSDGYLQLPPDTAEIKTPNAEYGNKDIDIYTSNWSAGSVEVYLLHDNKVNITTGQGAHEWAFSNLGELTVPGTIKAQDGSDLTLTSWNPTVDGIPGGVSISLQNRDIETGNRNTKLDLSPTDITLITDFSNAENTWTFGADGSLTLPTNGTNNARLNFGQPATRSPSWSAKNELITLYDFNDPGNKVNYGIGVSDSVLWNSVDSTDASFMWYGGENAPALQVKGDGRITIFNTINGQGFGKLDLMNGPNGVYLTPDNNDFAGVFITHTDADLYAAEVVRLSNVKSRTDVHAVNLGSGDNVIVVSTEAFPATSQITPSWTFYDGYQSYYISDVNVDVPQIGQISITVMGAPGWSNPGISYDSDVVFQSPEQWQEWTFDTNGVLNLPVGGDIKDSNGNSVLGTGGGGIFDMTYKYQEGVYLDGYQAGTGATRTGRFATGNYNDDYASNAIEFTNIVRLSPTDFNGDDKSTFFNFATDANLRAQIRVTDSQGNQVARLVTTDNLVWCNDLDSMYNGRQITVARMYGRGTPSKAKIMITQMQSQNFTGDYNTDSDWAQWSNLQSDNPILVVLYGQNSDMPLDLTQLWNFATSIVDNIAGLSATDASVQFYSQIDTLIANAFPPNTLFQDFDFFNQNSVTINAGNCSTNVTGNSASFDIKWDQTHYWVQYSGSQRRINPGSGYTVGDVFVAPGSLFGGVDTENDLTLTVTEVDADGRIVRWTVTGVPLAGTAVWPVDNIDDGGADQEDNANYIFTNFTGNNASQGHDRGTDGGYLQAVPYNDGQVADGTGYFSPAAGGTSLYVTAYRSSVFMLYVTDNQASLIETDGNSGFDGNSRLDHWNSPKIKTYDIPVKVVEGGGEWIKDAAYKFTFDFSASTGDVQFYNNTLATEKYGIQMAANWGPTNAYVSVPGANFLGGEAVELANAGYTDVFGHYRNAGVNILTNYNGPRWTFNGDYNNSYTNANGTNVEYLKLPNNARITAPGTAFCPINVDTIVYTGTSNGVASIKLFIQAEGSPDSASGDAPPYWETQAADAIAVVQTNVPGEASLTVFGRVYTGASPVATFTARHNLTTGRLEILARPTSVTYPVYVRITATEMLSADY